ncbi:hypothetical protein sphantq_04503 (plasmid) [Sphingobium sp. AntQ-1]|uniref:phosphotransferase n=1 Tax=Sphingobium sp. AntQ-1 TaxID=2930091 RepID=UPI00234E9806|nr:phosphotransferase [Sphingobium sp. AntQ-1]WCP16011.1 hypothetical protein sphantq_04503 [Sphingobium sp. AntQ-1]
MLDHRRDEEAIVWAEAQMGGRVVARERQNRWRPHWTLDMDLGVGGVKKVLLRGYRNPGYTEMDHSGSRAFLAREADFLAALQDVPVKLPRYYGQNRDLGWILMEFLPGETELTALEDADRRFTIYRQYVEELAKLHAYPLDRIALPKVDDEGFQSDFMRVGVVDGHRQRACADCAIRRTSRRSG